MSGIKERVVSLIERTQDPTAPIKIQELYQTCGQVGKMLTVLTTLEAVKDVQNRLLLDFCEEELEELSNKPEFVIALASCLSIAIEDFVRQGDKTDTPMG